MVLDKDGYLWASGSNGYGQIGNGKCGDYEFNYDISTFEKIGDAKWKFICASSFNSAGIQEDGTLWIWGANTYGQLGQPSVSTYGGVYTPSKVNDAQLETNQRPLINILRYPKRRNSLDLGKQLGLCNRTWCRLRIRRYADPIGN